MISDNHDALAELGGSTKLSVTDGGRWEGGDAKKPLATSASANDAPGSSIQRQLRHKKFDTTMRYMREGQIFRKNAAGMAGL
jgi:hypothetical protein